MQKRIRIMPHHFNENRIVMRFFNSIQHKYVLEGFCFCTVLLLWNRYTTEGAGTDEAFQTGRGLSRRIP